jgi:uncharacterized protein YjbI with pentapeptide repeats
MSEQQSQTATSTLTGIKWGDPISQERQRELQSYIDRWDAETDHGERQGPFHGVKLSGADVFCLAVRALARIDSEKVREEVRVWLLRAGDEARDAMGWPLSADVMSADLSRLHLEFANLSGAALERSVLNGAHLERTDLGGAHLKHASLCGAHLEGANCRNAHLEYAFAHEAHLEGASFNTAHLEGAMLGNAHLERAQFILAHLEEAYLDYAHLAGAVFMEAHLEGTRLLMAHLEGKRIPAEDVVRMQQWVPEYPDVLPPAGLNMAFLDSATMLTDIILGDDQFGYAVMGDVHWGDANLAVVNWSRAKRGFLGISMVQAIELGDERIAHTATDQSGKQKDEATRLRQYSYAVRANRQLATVLRQQGLNEDADRFAYHAQVVQREVLLLQHHYLRYLGSLFLGLIAGYGYRPLRSFATYLLVVTLFGLSYWALGIQTGHTLTWNEAGVVSLTAFHGRGFFATAFQPGDPQAAVAAIEAVIGLLIEITFIATFTQRFFAR